MHEPKASDGAKPIAKVGARAYPRSHIPPFRCHHGDVIDTLPDAQLVHQTVAGDPEAFAALVRRHRRAVLARALAIVGDTADAEDVAQDSFVQAWDHLAACRHPELFGAWIGAITRRQALNHLRAVRRRRLVPLDASVSAASGEHAAARLEREDQRRPLLLALARLTPVQREVLLLADLEDWSHDAIAKATGLSVFMSRRHLSDARRLLRTLLAPPEADQ